MPCDVTAYTRKTVSLALDLNKLQRSFSKIIGPFLLRDFMLVGRNMNEGYGQDLVWNSALTLFHSDQCNKRNHATTAKQMKRDFRVSIQVPLFQLLLIPPWHSRMGAGFGQSDPEKNSAHRPRIQRQRHLETTDEANKYDNAKIKELRMLSIATLYCQVTIIVMFSIVRNVNNFTASLGLSFEGVCHCFCLCLCFCLCFCLCHCLFLVRSFFLITLSKCLKGHKSQRSLFESVL